MNTPEIGVCDVELSFLAREDAIFRTMPSAIPVVQWHGAEVAKMPRGGVVLAHNKSCSIQAMRIGQQAYGVQYHVEIEATTIESWGKIPQYRRALEEIRGSNAQHQFERAASEQLAMLHENASALYLSFRDIAQRAADAR
jgi:GMP synthase-like glutamine amidotransferase